MFRALSVRRSREACDRLGDESSVGNLEAKLRKSKSLSEGRSVEKSAEKEVKKASKIHPIFSIFFEKRRKKKVTAKPEFGRYLEYLKEGGIWDNNSNMPVIYYKSSV